MITYTTIAVMSGVALSCGAVQSPIFSRTSPALVAGRTPSVPTLPLRPFFPRSTLRIEKVRLEAPPADAPNPSTVLKFDVFNDGAVSVTDIVIKIAILEKTQGVGREVTLPRVLVGPFTIRGHATIEAGYTVNYEMLLQNLSSDCRCQADVSVASWRAAPEPGL
jgi:hypothetical protein